MSLPLFYIDEYDASQKEIVLEEETSRHIVQVLRMKVGEMINLTDGEGNLLTAEIVGDHKKRCTVKIIDSRFTTHGSRKITIAISLLKNPSRFEWFLEKATEIGVHEIIPLICERTEKEKFRFERMNGILISALLQSQQSWLPILHEPVQFDNLKMRQCANDTNFIAHCANDYKQQLSNIKIDTLSNYLICIGPEGDFTKQEIDLAIQNKFIPVSLGDTRLRSETAGIVAAALLCRR
jgi:16S rRNA (uracil1498-N3)-methyltransferase